MNEIKTQRNVLLSEAESALKALYLTQLASSGAYRNTYTERYKPPKYKFLGYHQPKPKIGRNSPCPCGSGKKYKKCCGKEEL